MQYDSQNRLASLYSDFSNLKTTNPDGYRANVDTWIAALTHASRAGVAPGSGTLSIRSGDALAAELQSKRLGRPLALQEVIVGTLPPTSAYTFICHKLASCANTFDSSRARPLRPRL